MHAGTLQEGAGAAMAGCPAAPRLLGRQRRLEPTIRRQPRQARRVAACEATCAAALPEEGGVDLAASAHTSTTAWSIGGGELVIDHAFVSQPPPQPLLPLWGMGAGGSLQGVPLGSGGGWVLAAAALLAARMGRVTAQQQRLDVRQLQFERERGRALSRELLTARARWASEEEACTSAEDARRVEEAAARAQEQLRREQQEQRKYQEEATRETERQRVVQEEKRRTYELAQAKMDAEYASRVEQERVVIEAQRAAARAAEDARRQEETERRRAAEEERQRRDEQERLEREAAIRQRLEERQALERQKKKFALRLEGTVALERPPKGTLLPGPVEREAAVRLQASCSSLLGGALEPVVADFGTASEAAEALPGVVGLACHSAAQAHASALRLQSMAGQGPLQWMDEQELQHWAATAAARSMLMGLAAGQQALQRFQAGGGGQQQAPFQARTEYGVLPEDNPERMPALLGRVIARIEAGDSPAAAKLLADMAEGEDESFYADLGSTLGPAGLERAPRMLGSALLLAHLLSHMLAGRPALSSDAPAWFEEAAAVMRQQLRERIAGAPPDSLELPATILGSTLGAGHPVAQEMAVLAERNLSPAARTARAERERRRQAELAARLLEEEWPDESEMKAVRAADREAKTPVPERCWALRNVAGTLALGSPSERSRARQLLEKAVLLKQQFAGAPDHPAVLPELAALADLLGGEPEWAQDAAGVAALAMRIYTRVAVAYQEAGDPVSAAALLEAALRQHEEQLGLRSSAVTSATRRVDTLVGSMSPDQRSAVAAARRQPAAQLLGRVVAAFTEELGAYKTGAAPSRVQQWEQQGVRLIGPLISV